MTDGLALQADRGGGADPVAAARPALRTLAEIGWAAGSLGTGALFNVLALFGLFFMTTVLGIAPAVAGAILFCSKLYDAMFDPVIGAVSDRTRHRWGPRRIYLLVGAPALGLSFALFFGLPPIGPAGSIVAALLALILFSTAYSTFAVPYLAMPPDLAPTYDERTRLMTFRVFFMVAGVLVGSLGAPFLLQAAGGDAAGYRLLGIALGAMTTATGLIAFAAAARLPCTMAPAPERPLTLDTALVEPYRAMIAALRAQPFRVLTVVKLCQLGVLSMAQACAPFFFKYVLGMTTQDIGTYLAVSVVAGLVALPPLRVLIARAGKRRAYLWLLALYSVALTTWFAWAPGEPIAFFYVRAAVLGILGNGTLLCVLSMLPDTMEYDRLRSGVERSGVISGAFTLVEKLAGALGPLVIGLLLQLSGLVQSKLPGVVQPPAALLAIRLGMSLLPAALSALGLVFLFRYRLDAAALASLRARAARVG